MIRSERQEERSGESGGVLVELAIVCPLLLVFSLCLYDVGNLLHLHRELSSVTREGLRLASGVPLLEEGDFRMIVSTDTGRPKFYYDVLDGPSGDCDQDPDRSWPGCGNGEKQRNSLSNGFSLLVDKAEDDAPFIDQYSPAIELRFRGSKINVMSSVEYRGVTSMFQGIVISASATGPYL